jgi:hypothetical protein
MYFPFMGLITGIIYGRLSSDLVQEQLIAPRCHLRSRVCHWVEDPIHDIFTGTAAF